MRWDQLDELATIIASHVKAEETVDQGLLKSIATNAGSLFGQNVFFHAISGFGEV